MWHYKGTQFSSGWPVKLQSWERCHVWLVDSKCSEKYAVFIIMVLSYFEEWNVGMYLTNMTSHPIRPNIDTKCARTANLNCKICLNSTNLQQPKQSATEQSLHSVYDSAKGESGLFVPEPLRSVPLCHYPCKHSSPVSSCHCPLTAYALWTPRYFLSKMLRLSLGPNQPIIHS
jgi:hypothetical protein